MMNRPLALGVLAVALGCSLTGCADERDVTLYVALDEEHSKRLVSLFEERTGLTVDANYDTEGTKTVGLVNNIVAESSRPRCDVFWNNELAHTVRLAQKGLLAPYHSPSAATIPAEFKDDAGYWTGFAARARVFIVNTELVPDPAERPTSMWDLTDPKWKGRCAVARPLTGTTLTHFTALYGLLGEQKFEEWLDGLEKNEVVFLQSNGATMRTVAETAQGIAFAFTDTDDFHVALTKGHPVACVFPDQGEDGIGTMLIPNSVAIVRNGPHPETAKQLVDFILSEEVEGLLAAAKSAQIPVRPAVKGPEEPSILGIGTFKAMAWDPEAVAQNLDRTAELFQQRYGH